MSHSVMIVIDEQVETSAERPVGSWAGHIVIDQIENGRYAGIQIYLTEEKARALVEQITEALASEAAPEGYTPGPCPTCSRSMGWDGHPYGDCAK